MKINTTNQDILKISTNCIVLFASEGSHQMNGETFQKVDHSFDGFFRSALENGEISTKNKEITLYNTFGKLPAKHILFVGIGERENVDTDLVREIAALVAKEMKKARLTNALITTDNLLHSQLTHYDLAHAFVEGLLLSDYTYKGIRKNAEVGKHVEEITFLVTEESKEEVEGGIITGSAFARGTLLARELVNTPANILTPTALAEQAVKVAKTHGMSVEVLGKNDMERLGMGGILAVSQGTVQPPKMVIIKYQGREQWDDVVGYVGKGITFDTGGISIKPAQKMGDMICDMGGAAAVIGAMDVIGHTKPKVNIMAVLPIAENMPAGNAYRPGDVITTMSGKTVEIISTDAEGRMILADAITYAKQLGVSKLVDVATLTGNAVLAFGDKASAVMTNNDEWLDKVKAAAAQTGEPIWQLPAFASYRKQILSKFADLKNSGGREAGAITAGMFLLEFAEETPWIHLDIAGTAWTEKQTDLLSVGGTGVMVRTLARLAEKCAIYN